MSKPSEREKRSCFEPRGHCSSAFPRMSDKGNPGTLDARSKASLSWHHAPRRDLGAGRVSCEWFSLLGRVLWSSCSACLALKDIGGCLVFDDYG